MTYMYIQWSEVTYVASRADNAWTCIPGTAHEIKQIVYTSSYAFICYFRDY